MAPPRQQRLNFGQTSLAPASEALSSTVSLSELNSELSVEMEAEWSGAITPAPSSQSNPVPGSSRPKLIRKERTSWVYKYMRRTDDPETLFLNKQGNPEWRYRFCLDNYQLSGGTINIKKHLNNFHNIYEDSPSDVQAKNIQIAIDDAIASVVANPQKRR
jgi:hypothetical protein